MVAGPHSRAVFKRRLAGLEARSVPADRIMSKEARDAAVTAVLQRLRGQRQVANEPIAACCTVCRQHNLQPRWSGNYFLTHCLSHSA
jgi:hypothetical protein